MNILDFTSLLTLNSTLNSMVYFQYLFGVEKKIVFLN